MAATGKDVQLTLGVRDPLKAESWLVRPSPADACFGQVVQHFLTTCVWRLQGERNTARQLAFWEAYQEALKVASTNEPMVPGASHRHDGLVRCVDECVAIFREKARAEGTNIAANEQQVSVTPTSANSCPTCVGRVS